MGIGDDTATNIFTNPSIDGPNLPINTQGVKNGQIEYSNEHSNIDGGSSPDWGVVEWRGQSAFNPESGTLSRVWDKNFGYSLGHWTQGETTSKSGKTSYNVFRDPTNGKYVYQMSAQGGNLLDVQLDTTNPVDFRYSFDHQITASFTQGISDYHGSTGSYQAGINFTVNFHSATMDFGLFLQFQTIESNGQPVTYMSLTPSLGGSIYNVVVPQDAYINPNLPSNDSVLYHTTIDVNKGLMAAIKAITNLHPTLSGELENLSNWYLNGAYIGVESIGSGLSSDVTGNYNIEDPLINYNTGKTVSYSSDPILNPVVSMVPRDKIDINNTEKEIAMSSVAVQGVNNTVVIQGVSSDTSGLMAKSYASNIQDFLNSNSLESAILKVGKNVSATSKEKSQAIVQSAGSYEIAGGFTNLVIAPTDTSSLAGGTTIDASQDNASRMDVVSSNPFGTDIKLGNNSGSFAATQGNNIVRASNSKGNWNIATGNGNDTIYGGCGTNSITGGQGNNVIYLGQANNFVTSVGQDTINGSNGSIDTVSIQGGKSSVALKTNAAVMDFSEKNSIAVGDNSTVYGGTSSVIHISDGNATVVGTQGDTISAAANLQVVHGSNQSISVSGALQFISGTGQSSISAGSGTVWGANALTATLSSPSTLLFTANQPYTTGDQFIDGRAVRGGLEAWTGAGQQTIIGGAASDAFYFGTAFTGSSASNVSATVTGGSGAGNMFGMLSNHTAGNFTITDFRAASNKFFLYNYKPENPAAEAQNIVNTATVAGGNTSIMIDGNAKINFINTTDLKASDFIIS